MLALIPLSRLPSRRTDWFAEEVVKHHRTLATMLNTLVETGFCHDRDTVPPALRKSPAGSVRAAMSGSYRYSPVSP